MPRAPRSPWIEQLGPLGPPLAGAVPEEADVVVVGAGIAGVATAFFLLRDTDRDVLLLERDRIAHGATGHNAGQIVSYFERPLCRMVDEFGMELAVAAQASVDDAWNLLDEMIAHTGADVLLERFIGHMGMFSLNHLQVHLRNQVVRRAEGLRLEPVTVSDEAPFLDELGPDFDGLFVVAPQDRIQELLQTGDRRYCAVLSNRKGCANSALLCVQVVAALLQRYPDRFDVVEGTAVHHLELGDGRVVLDTGARPVMAKRVVLCTNGSTSFSISSKGRAVSTEIAHRVSGTIGYMAAFVEPAPRLVSAYSFLASPRINEGQAYYYVTRRTWPGAPGPLTCIGGPDREAPASAPYSEDDPYPDEILTQMDDFIRPILDPGRAAPLEYEYLWHGLMGYTGNGMRVIGPEPSHPALLYNLGCNGVGILPSIFGGHRIARLVAGHPAEPSPFDPR